MTSSRSVARATTRGNSPVRPHCPAQTVNLRTTTSRVYVASSLSTYATPEYSTNLERITELFPDAEILAARDLFTSNADWLRKWPGIVLQIDALIFFEHADGYIGYGVWTEISDALAHGIPVYLLRDSSQHPWSAVEIGERRPTNWRQYARLSVAQRIGSGHDG